MINNPTFQSYLVNNSDFSTIVEIYDSSFVPSGATAFNPASAIGRFAGIPLTYRSQTYVQAIDSISNIKRTLGSEVNSASVTFSNVDKQISRFESTNGFEGLIMVIRLISRGSSTITARSLILFAGRCEKPREGTAESLTVTATWMLGGPKNVVIPRRKYTKEDQDGRVNTDPEFEGFESTPQESGTTTYRAQEKRGGIAGFFGLKKWVARTLVWSSYSDLDASKVVPETFGTTQLIGTHIAFADTGTVINFRAAFCEGEVTDVTGFRSLDPQLPMSGPPDFVIVKGKVGAANYDSGGIAPANYSRTVVIRGKAIYSAIDVNDTAPDIVATLVDRILLTPDSGGTWNTNAGTDNAADITRYVVTSPFYFNLDPAWINDTAFFTVWNFNNELIISRNASDLIWLKEN